MGTLPGASPPFIRLPPDVEAQLKPPLGGSQRVVLVTCLGPSVFGSCTRVVAVRITVWIESAASRGDGCKEREARQD
jgi:hypothetical protein